ncbi:hypothetical protein [Kiloniella sp. b19]|uniref:hypothetical protein n=1 Tax=Kiloniella sp. GXU_MW_B19 TaxID=3141326 RepID=UPI0031CEC753
MRKTTVVFSTTLALAFGLAVSSAQAFNEPRWYQQQVCLAGAYQALNSSSKADNHQQAARTSRQKLARSGVPESHIRELERSSRKMLKLGTSKNRQARGPQLCNQWYPA